MITKSTVRKVMPLFVFLFLYLVWSCKPDPVIKTDDKDKTTSLNLRVTSLDSSGNKKDTIYKFTLTAKDTFSVNHVVYCEKYIAYGAEKMAYKEPPKTGGSSPSTITIAVWKDPATPDPNHDDN
jgi:hypothetical protein